MVPDGCENGSNAAKAEGMIKSSGTWRRFLCEDKKEIFMHYNRES